MGFWSYPSDSASPPKPKISADGTPIAPNRTERSKCWEARDIYFQCLDKHDIVDSIKEGEKAAKECPVEEKGFATNCASSWVTYFKQRRVMEFKRAKTLRELAEKGATELPPGAGLPPSGPR